MSPKAKYIVPIKENIVRSLIKFIYYKKTLMKRIIIQSFMK